MRTDHLWQAVLRVMVVVAASALALPPAAHAAARSVHVIIKNNTAHTLLFVAGKASHGKVTRKPPSRISPGGVGELFAESAGVATGTEGFVKYRLEGVAGEAQFNWDNPFAGNNSASGSAPAGFAVEHIGDKGNRTLVFFSIHDRNNPQARCNADWVLANLGKHAEKGLDNFDEAIGFLTTPGKRLGVGGWVDTGCHAEAEGWPVRDAQHSTDGFWTIDVKLHSFTIDGKRLPSGGTRYVRIEVEPGTAAHGAAGASPPKANRYIRFSGHVLIDTHHGDELVEVHPTNAIAKAPEPLDSGKDTCKQGFVWREAVAADHVCVTAATRDQAKRDNAEAPQRKQPQGGASGPDTCKSGFVWREVTASDHVCVTPQTRQQTTQDNSRAAQRRVRG